MEIRRLTSTEELFAVAEGDYLLRTDVSPGMQGFGWAAADGGLAVCGPTNDGMRGWLTVLGAPGAGAEALLRHALAELPQPPLGVSVPRGTDTGWLELVDRETWDYMVYESSAEPPAQPGEERVAALAPSPENDAEIEEFLKKANPTYSAKPGWEAIRSWATIRDDAGSLLAVGAYCVRDGASGYLASIGTLPAVRGQGLGAAVTAWLTRRSLRDGNPFCSLGHYWPNEPARRLYLRLGFRTTHEMSSGRFVEEGVGGDAAVGDHTSGIEAS